MANLAAEARAKAQTMWPGAVVVERGRGYIKHRHPTQSNRFMLDTQVGGVGWHYGPLLDQEVDTAWQPAVAPWAYKMVKAEFNAKALSLLNAGQVIEYSDPDSGQWIRFQPMALQYSNVLNQISQISMPQAIDAQVDDDTLTWVNGYGAGRTLVWQAQTARLYKELQLVAGSLPAVPQFIRDGGSPVLELNFIFAYSSGITPWINGTAWTGSQADRDTQGLVEFKDATGKILWWFALPLSWDSGGSEQLGTFHFKKTGNSLYLSHCIPLAWVEDAARVWPIKVDTTVDVQVGASTDDCSESGGGPTFSLTNAFDRLTTYENIIEVGARFITINIAQGVTVNNGTFISWSQYSTYWQEGAVVDTIQCDDVDDSATFVNEADFDGRARTSASISYTTNASGGANAWHNSSEAKTIIQEVVSRPGWVANKSISILTYAAQQASLRCIINTYNGSTTLCPKLHIEYTAGTPATLTCVVVPATCTAPNAALLGKALLSGVLVTATAASPNAVLTGKVLFSSALVTATAAAPNAGLLAKALFSAAVAQATTQALNVSILGKGLLAAQAVGVTACALTAALLGSGTENVRRSAMRWLGR